MLFRNRNDAKVNECFYFGMNVLKYFFVIYL
jgi:hypothetical protein